MTIHLLIKTKFAYLPESVAIVFVGAMFGGLIELLKRYHIANWEVFKHVTIFSLFYVFVFFMFYFKVIFIFVWRHHKQKDI